jgi:hypothetical protein
VSSTASLMLCFGRQPSFPMREVSKCISGISPVQPCRPPEKVSRGESFSRPVIQPTLSSTWQTSSVPRLKYLNALVGRCTAEQYAVDAVLDVQIGFALLAVAQNVQPSRILCKLPHEIENMPVAVALAEDRYKAKNARFHAVPFGVGSDHPLARELRGAVN